MLTRFRVKNYKSIRDEIILDMRAVAISEHKKQVVSVKNDDKFLPVAVFYGPNGSGKSNVLEALRALCHYVTKPVLAVRGEEMRSIPITPFLSEEFRELPTEFEVSFVDQLSLHMPEEKGYEYRYALHVREKRVIYECLKRRKLTKGRWSNLFTRDKNGISLKDEFEKMDKCEDIPEHLAFLSWLGITQGRNVLISGIMDWFTGRINFLNYSDPACDVSIYIGQSDLGILSNQILKNIDPDIEDVITEGGEEWPQIYIRRNMNGRMVNFSFDMESSGIQKLYGIIPLIAKSLLFGETLVVDELDTKLHPMVIRRIMEFYTDIENVNHSGAQLIFTSHDLPTMSIDLLRRDEIWFVEKDESLVSVLSRLTDKKREKGDAVRKDAKFDKQYMEGKYGALPKLSDDSLEMEI